MTPTEAGGIVTDLLADNQALFLVVFPAIAGAGIAFAMVKRAAKRIKGLG
jgi:hypothetical protein